MHQRPLPNHPGIQVSAVGFGGVVLSSRPQAECDADVAWAIDQGINYFDVAPQYANAQELMGPALAPFRDGVFLACKTLERGGDAAQAELDDSLTKLKTDYFDLYQLHSLQSVDDYREAERDGGALQTLLDAKASGKARLIGVSAHDEDAALAAVASGHFDSVMLPINYANLNHSGFGRRLLPAAQAANLTLISLKALAKGKITTPWENRKHDKCWYDVCGPDEPELAHLQLRYALNQPGVIAALPPGQPEIYKMAVGHAAADISPLNESERAQLAAAYEQPASEPLFPQ